MNETFKWTGLVGVVIAWLGMLLLLVIWETDKGQSLSHHAAARRKSFLMMAGMETVTLPLVWLYMVGWLAPHYSLNPLFVLLGTWIALGLLIAAWVPVTGPNGKFHDFCAQSAAVLSVPTTLLLAASPNLSLAARIICLVVCLVLGVMVFLYYVVRRTRHYFLYFQTAAFILFHIAILSAGFIR